MYSLLFIVNMAVVVCSLRVRIARPALLEGPASGLAIKDRTSSFTAVL